MGAPWFKFFPTQFLADAKVKMLSREHRSMLIELWCYCAQDGKLPSDLEGLSRLLGESLPATKRAMERLAPFFVQEGDWLYSQRLKKEAEAYESKCQKLRSNASKGGRKKTANAKPKGKANARSNGTAEAQAKASTENKQLGLEAEAEVQKYCTSPNGEVCTELRSMPEAPVLGKLPCVGGQEKEWPYTEKMLAEWRQAFPGVAVLEEIRRMRLWLEANPAKRKTFKGMPCFVLRWLGRAQDTARNATPAARPLRNSRAPEADAAFLAQLNNLDSSGF